MTDPRSPSTDGDLDLMALLPRLAQLGTLMNRSRLVERAMERAGVSVDRPAMSVLLTLRIAEAPLRIGEIAQRMQVVGPHVTRQVHELERRGLARRVPDPSDRRARLIELTPEGLETANGYVQTMLGWFTEALAGWTKSDRRTFGHLLGRFADDLAARLKSLDA